MHGRAERQQPRVRSADSEGMKQDNSPSRFEGTGRVGGMTRTPTSIFASRIATRDPKAIRFGPSVRSRIRRSGRFSEANAGLHARWALTPRRAFALMCAEQKDDSLNHESATKFDRPSRPRKTNMARAKLAENGGWVHRTDKTPGNLDV